MKKTRRLLFNMTGTSMIFFGLGAVVLWGGLIVTLTITIKNERKAKLQ